jgi:hypothetical protein
MHGLRCMRPWIDDPTAHADFFSDDENERRCRDTSTETGPAGEKGAHRGSPA